MCTERFLGFSSLYAAIRTPFPIFRFLKGKEAQNMRVF